MKKEAYFKMMGLDKKADIFSGIGNFLGGAYNTAKDAYNVLEKLPGQYWRINVFNPAKAVGRGVKGAVQSVGKGFEQATQDGVKAMQEKLKAQRVKKAVENRQRNIAIPTATKVPAVTSKQETKTVSAAATPATAQKPVTQTTNYTNESKSPVQGAISKDSTGIETEEWLKQYPQMEAALKAAKANRDVKGLGFWERLWNQIKAWFGSKEGEKALRQDEESKSKWQEAYDKFQAFYGNPESVV